MFRGCLMFMFTMIFVSFFSLVAGYFMYFQLAKSEIISMPSLIGLSEQQAVKSLRDADLVLQEIRTREDFSVPPGTVIEQIPKQLTDVKVGRGVVIVIAKEVQKTTVPDLKGLKTSDVPFKLKDFRLAVEKVCRTYHPTVGLDEVIAINPPSGSEIPADSTIDILVSRGPRPTAYVMPDLVNMTEEEARSVLKQLPIPVRRTLKPVSDSSLRNRVIGQSPSPGKRLLTQEGIELTVGAYGT